MQQETYFEQNTDGVKIAVLKTYDRQFARDSFNQMSTEALDFLQERLETGNKDEGNDALWEEIEEGARENWNTFSYFVVTETSAGQAVPLFVSSDWPSAEAFVQQHLQESQSGLHNQHTSQ